MGRPCGFEVIDGHAKASSTTQTTAAAASARAIALPNDEGGFVGVAACTGWPFEERVRCAREILEFEFELDRSKNNLIQI